MAKKEIEMYYYKYPNFGDLLNELIMEKTGNIAKYKNFDSCDIVMIGSILDKFYHNSNIGEGDKKRQMQADTSKPVYIWGTGLMYDYGDTDLKPIRPFEVKALRGELTRKQVSKTLGRNVECVTCDPGILASHFVKAEEKKYDVGIIPHYVDEKDEIFAKMKETYPDSLLIDVHADTETVLKQISSCRRIFSTSLHGIIVSDSYGVPNCWCESSDRILGDGYKYHDYFSSFGKDRKPFSLREGDIPDPDKECALTYDSYEEVIKKQEALLACFPYLHKKWNPFGFFRKK